MRRFLPIALVTLLAALGLSLVLNRLDPGDPAAEVAAARTEHHASVELTAAGMVPPKLRVPKDREIHLLVSAAPDAPAGMLTLLGYHDRVDAVGVGPGLARKIVFVSDRPGDDFAFQLGGEMVGRLEVTGSHLQEGHR